MLDDHEKAACFDFLMDDIRKNYNQHVNKGGMRAVRTSVIPLSICRAMIRDCAHVVRHLRVQDGTEVVEDLEVVDE